MVLPIIHETGMGTLQLLTGGVMIVLITYISVVSSDVQNVVIDESSRVKPQAVTSSQVEPSLLSINCCITCQY